MFETLVSFSFFPEFVSFSFVVLIVVFVHVGRFILDRRIISPLAQAWMHFFENVQIGDVIEYAHGYRCISNHVYIQPYHPEPCTGNCFHQVISYNTFSYEEHLTRKEKKLVRRKSNEAYVRILSQRVGGLAFGKLRQKYDLSR